MSFWDEFYSAEKAPQLPTDFFHFVESFYRNSQIKILEIGCGNGRDSFAFLKSGHNLLALDASASAINFCIEKSKSELSLEMQKKIAFIQMDLDEILNEENAAVISKYSPNLFYSRFLLHAIAKPMQDKVILFCGKYLEIGTWVAHEFRTNKDPLMNFGHQIGQNERVTDHYRRFIEPTEVIESLKEQGYEIKYFQESNGLAVYKDENPVVARIIARKVK